jgi:hypothetical protein
MILALTSTPGATLAQAIIPNPLPDIEFEITPPTLGIRFRIESKEEHEEAQSESTEQEFLTQTAHNWTSVSRLKHSIGQSLSSSVGVTQKGVVNVNLSASKKSSSTFSEDITVTDKTERKQTLTTRKKITSLLKKYEKASFDEKSGYAGFISFTLRLLNNTGKTYNIQNIRIEVFEEGSPETIASFVLLQENLSGTSIPGHHVGEVKDVPEHTFSINLEPSVDGNKYSRAVIVERVPVADVVKLLRSSTVGARVSSFELRHDSHDSKPLPLSEQRYELMSRAAEIHVIDPKGRERSFLVDVTKKPSLRKVLESIPINAQFKKIGGRSILISALGRTSDYVPLSSFELNAADLQQRMQEYFSELGRLLAPRFSTKAEINFRAFPEAPDLYEERMADGGWIIGVHGDVDKLDLDSNLSPGMKVSIIFLTARDLVSTAPPILTKEMTKISVCSQPPATLGPSQPIFSGAPEGTFFNIRARVMRDDFETEVLEVWNGGGETYRLANKTADIRNLDSLNDLGLFISFDRDPYSLDDLASQFGDGRWKIDATGEVSLSFISPVIGGLGLGISVPITKSKGYGRKLVWHNQPPIDCRTQYQSPVCEWYFGFPYREVDYQEGRKYALLVSMLAPLDVDDATGKLLYRKFMPKTAINLVFPVNDGNYEIDKYLGHLGQKATDKANICFFEG